MEPPILILSGLTGISDKVMALGLGADDYMTKPFQTVEFIVNPRQELAHVLGHSGAAGVFLRSGAQAGILAQVRDRATAAAGGYHAGRMAGR